MLMFLNLIIRRTTSTSFTLSPGNQSGVTQSLRSLSTATVSRSSLMKSSSCYRSAWRSSTWMLLTTPVCPRKVMDQFMPPHCKLKKDHSYYDFSAKNELMDLLKMQTWFFQIWLTRHGSPRRSPTWTSAPIASWCTARTLMLSTQWVVPPHF